MRLEIWSNYDYCADRQTGLFQRFHKISSINLQSIQEIPAEALFIASRPIERREHWVPLIPGR